MRRFIAVWRGADERQQRLAALQPQRAKAETDLHNLQQNLAREQQQLATQQQALDVLQQHYAQTQQQRAALFGDRAVNDASQQHKQQVQHAEQHLAEQQRLLQHAQQQLHSLTGQREQLSSQLDALRLRSKAADAEFAAALAQSDFSDEAALRAALLDDAEAQPLRQRLQQLEKQLQQAIILQEQVAQRLDIHQQQRPVTLTDEHAAALPAQLDALRTALRDTAQQQGEAQQQLQSDARLRDQQQSLLTQITEDERTLAQLSQLNDLIGSAKGDKFRRFAQGLTLDHLVWLANRQLDRLHGRYLLQRRLSDELELEVVDTWQADATRDTRTLSGGESFIVSLALALALSDLVSHKTRIESLFLDEGFGTLDAETLDAALDALDALNASGKTIGVISHVEAMKERIPVQIKVRKVNGLGFSKLELPA